jgi:hypothetical protein
MMRSEAVRSEDGVPERSLFVGERTIAYIWAGQRRWDEYSPACVQEQERAYSQECHRNFHISDSE